eukprot:40208-Chlamydomonas_euryale.AAC.3
MAADVHNRKHATKNARRGEVYEQEQGPECVREGGRSRRLAGSAGGTLHEGLSWPCLYIVLRALLAQNVCWVVRGITRSQTHCFLSSSPTFFPTCYSSLPVTLPYLLLMSASCYMLASSTLSSSTPVHIPRQPAFLFPLPPPPAASPLTSTEQQSFHTSSPQLSSNPFTLPHLT